MITRVLALLFAVTVAVSAQSQPPAPGKRVTSENQQAQASRQNTTPERAETPTPPSSAVVVTISNQSAADTAAQQPNQEPSAGQPATSPRRWFKDWGTWSDVLIMLSTVMIGFFTWRMWVVSDLQRKTLDETLMANKVVERAYVNASPVPIDMEWQSGGPRHQIKISNNGQTQATIRAVSQHILPFRNSDDWDEPPVYPPSTRSGAFLLAPGDAFYEVALPTGFTEESDAAEFAASQLPVKLVGYVDYEDIFGDFHRVGWGRHYFPAAPQADRKFGIIVQDGYSYDRPLTVDEKKQHTH